MIMRFMHWSYEDLCKCPQFHLDVLFDELEEERRKESHDRAVAEAKAGTARRRR